MLKSIPLRCVMAASAACLLAGCTQEASQKVETAQAVRVPAKPEKSPSGEALYKQFCSSCHPDGGNVSDPSRPLYGSALRRNHITKPEDIVRIIRTPLSRMIRFDVSTLSDQDARAIAEYILGTFK